MNHYHIAFVDDEGDFYSASVETDDDLFTSAGIDSMAQDLAGQLGQDEPVAILNIIPLKS
jgi:hypothetical protein